MRGKNWSRIPREARTFNLMFLLGMKFTSEK